MIDRVKILSVVIGLAFCYLIISNVDLSNSHNLKMNLQAKMDLQISNQDDEYNYILDGDQETSPANVSGDVISQFKTLQEINFLGEWDSRIPGNKLFSDFESLTGKIRLNFFNELADANYWNFNLLSNMTYLQIIIVDGEYYDNKVYQIKLNNSIHTVLNTKTLMYSHENKLTNVSEFNSLTRIAVQECTMSIELDLNQIIKKDPENEENYIIADEAPIKLSIKSSDCNLSIESNLYKDPTVTLIVERILMRNKNYETKIINYSILLTFIGIVNLYSIAKMIKTALESAAEANKISMLSIGFITIWDSFICIAHLYCALSTESLFHFFIMPTFWYFILFSIFEFKLLIIVWRARYFLHYENYDVIRRAAVTFYCKLYTAIFVFLILFYKYIYYNSFLLLMSLYLVPQIIHNAMKGGRIDFDKNYMFLIVGTRVILPLYFKGCTKNILVLHPSPIFCILLLLVVGGQILMIYYQSIFGAKFFYPDRFLPLQYDYLYNLPDDLEAGLASQDDCAVCMNSLGQEGNTQNADNHHTRLIMNRLKPRRGQIMKTPCNHKFHVNCLVEWMSIKMECPTCRAPLPVLD